MALPPPSWGRVGVGGNGSPSPLVGEGWGGGEWLSLPPRGGGLGWGGMALPPPSWGRVGVGGNGSPSPLVGEGWGGGEWLSLPPRGGGLGWGGNGSPSPLVGEGWGGGEWLSLPPRGGGLGWGGNCAPFNCAQYTSPHRSFASCWSKGPNCSVSSCPQAPLLLDLTKFREARAT